MRGFRRTVNEKSVIQAVALQHEAWAGLCEGVPGEVCGRTVEEREDSQYNPDDQHEHIYPESKPQEVQGE